MKISKYLKKIIEILAASCGYYEKEIKKGKYPDLDNDKIGR